MLVPTKITYGRDGQSIWFGVNFVKAAFGS